MKSDRVFVLILITILFFNTCSTDKKNNDKGMTNTQSEEENTVQVFTLHHKKIG